MHHPVLSARRLTLIAITLTSACEAEGSALAAAHDSIGGARQDSILRAQPGYVVDSARSTEEALRRFRADIKAAPSAFTGGERTREALVAAFARAVERGDSLDLRRMSMTRGEFAFLVYPSSAYTRPPYRQQPEIAWLLLSAAGDKGLRRLIERRAGHPFRLVGYECARDPDSEGENRLWRGCTVRRVRAAADTATERLFGPIIERGGQFKFYSYGNEL